MTDTTQLTHRAKAYVRGLIPGSDTIIFSGMTTKQTAHTILGGLLAMPRVTGGHIEVHVQGIGWVVESEQHDADPEAIPPTHPFDPHNLNPLN